MAVTTARSMVNRLGVASRVGQTLDILGLERIGPLAVVGGGLLALSIFLGGGTRNGFATDFLLQLACIPAFVGTLFLYDPDSRPPSGGVALFCLLMIAVPLVQLVPLPPWLWTHLPGHGLAAATYATLGESVAWRPLSLTPRDTALALTSLIVPITMVLLVSRMNYIDRRFLVVVAIALAAMSSVLGLVQIAGGPQSAFRFYAITNPTDAVGFFANRNHFATFMAASILLLAPFAIPPTDPKTGSVVLSEKMSAIYAALGIACILFIGALSGSKSRAGLVLGVAAFIGGAYIILRDRNAGRNSAVVKYSVLAATGVMMVIAPLALSRTADRFTADPLQDGRVMFTLKTLRLALTNLPFGSGMGSFQAVYSMNETPQQMILNTYLNRAHNDLAEILLEAGVLAGVFLAVFLIWYVRRAILIWTRPMSGATSLDAAIAKSATLVILITGLHSLLDYPLRTGAMMAMIAMCVGLMLPTIPAQRRQAVQAIPERTRRRRASLARETTVAVRDSVDPASADVAAEAALRAAATRPARRKEPAQPYAYSSEAAKTFDWPDAWREEPKSRTAKPESASEPPADPK